MIDITDNFAVAIRLNDIYNLDATGTTVIVSHGRKGFDVTLRDPRTGVEDIRNYKWEEQVWRGLPAVCPALLPALAGSTHLYHRGLARRAELYAAPKLLEAATVQFERVPRLMFDTMLEVLDGVKVSRETSKLRPTANKRGISLWQLRARCHLPQYATPEPLVLKVFPSPVDSRAWLMRVELPGHSADIIRSNQAAIRRAIQLLDGRGVVVEDVGQGTLLDLS
jgi:hypothetical protein